MSLATRCPQCQTVFRVVPDQLRVSEGWVRCGRCAEVFNAAQHLVDPTTGEPRRSPIEVRSGLPPPARDDAEEAGGWAPGRTSGARTSEPDRADDLDSQESDFADFVHTEVPEDDDAIVRLVPSEDLDDELDWRRPASARSAPGAAGTQRGAGGAGGAGTPGSTGATGSAGATGSPAAGGGTTAAGDTSSTMASSRATGPGALSAPGAPGAPGSLRAGAAPARARAGPASAPGELPSFVRKAQRAARWRQPGMRALLGVGVLATGLLLAAQWLMVDRDHAATRWPELRPLLTQACASLGCRIEAWRAIDALVVENSAVLQVEKTDVYKLSIALRNKRDLDVALPAIDLSLTDLQGQLIARRVLRAAELGAHGLTVPANAEVTLQATIQVAAAPVAGYTIELFYP